MILPFMYQRDGVAIVGNSVFNRRANQTFSAFFRTRFDTDRSAPGSENFLHAHLFARGDAFSARLQGQLSIQFRRR